MNVTVLGKLSQLLGLTSYLGLSCCETAPDMSTQCWLALQYVQVSCVLTAIQGKLQDAVMSLCMSISQEFSMGKEVMTSHRLLQSAQPHRCVFFLYLLFVDSDKNAS